MYLISCSCGREYKCETSHPLRVTMEEYWKGVVRGDTIKSGIADHLWKERNGHQPVEWSENTVQGKTPES